MDISSKILSDIISYMKYAKYIPDIKRRETWDEIVTRNMEMHIKKYPQLEERIRKHYKLVYERKVLPSMRSMQFAGKSIEISPNRLYNCAYLPIDDFRAFSEIMFLLLGGCFEPETEIMTFDGSKKIKDVTCDDLVKTYDIETNSFEWVHPTFAGITNSANKDKIELEFDDNTKIICTSDHKFFTTNRGWIEAKDLDENDDIKVFEKDK